MHETTDFVVLACPESPNPAIVTILLPEDWMCPSGSRGAIKSYPWRDEPSGNSLERARFSRMRFRSVSSVRSAGVSMMRSRLPVSSN
jgi:hypothetical protein